MNSEFDDLLDEMEQAETCDFVSEFAYPLPSLVIFDLLGVPAEDHETMREAAQGLVTFPSTVYKGDFGAMEHIAERLTRAQGVLERLIQQRRRVPKKDLISILLHAETGTAQLPDDEIVVLCNFLLGAGHETTANLLSGSLRYLLERRELWEQLGAGPKMIPTAVEIVRADTPGTIRSAAFRIPAALFLASTEISTHCRSRVLTGVRKMRQAR